MPRYDFVSPGAMAGASLEDYLIRREEEKRQALLDALTTRNVESGIRARDTQTDIATAQEGRASAAASQAEADRADAEMRERKAALYENARTSTRTIPYAPGSDTSGLPEQTPGILIAPGPGLSQIVDPRDRPAAEANTQQIMGAQAAGQQQAATRAAGLEAVPEDLRPLVDAGIIDGLDPEDVETPEARNARLMAEEDAAVRRAGRIAAAQAAGRQSETAPGIGPSELAVMAARNPTMLQQMTPTQQGEILAEIANDSSLSAQYEDGFLAPARAQAETIVSALGDLIQPTGGGEFALTVGARQIFGERTPTLARGLIPTAGATDANASLRQVIGQEVVDMLNTMKSQSPTGATGFGPLSERELDILLSSATRLSSRLTEESALQELTTLYNGFSKLLQPTVPGGGPGGSALVVTAPDGSQHRFDTPEQAQAFEALIQGQGQ